MIEQFFKFCVVGGSGVFVDFGVTYLCKEWLKLNKYVANSLGFLCASTSNYILNRIWTFQNENPDITGQYLRFLGIAAVGLVINNATIYVLHGRFRLNFYLAKLFAIGVVTFWNFFLHLLTGLSFRPRIICVCGYGGRGVSAPRRTPLRRFLPTSSTFPRGVRRR